MLSLSHALSEARNLREAAEAAFKTLQEPFGLQTFGFSTVPRQSQTYQASHGVCFPFDPDASDLLADGIDAAVVPEVFGLLQAESPGTVKTWTALFEPNNDLHVHALDVFRDWLQAQAGMFLTTGNDAEMYSNAAMHRGDQPFTHDDQVAFRTIAPVLQTVVQSLILRERAELVLAGADEIAPLQDKFLLLLDAQLEVQWASTDYRQRLEPFVGTWDAALCPEIAEWLRRVAMPHGKLESSQGPWQKTLRRRRGAARLRAAVVRGSTGALGLLVDITLRDPAEQLARLRKLGLTPREVDVVGFLPRGLTNHQIAHALGIREVTVKKHLRSIGDKLGARGKVAIFNRLTHILNHPDWPDPQGL